MTFRPDLACPETVQIDTASPPRRCQLPRNHDCDHAHGIIRWARVAPLRLTPEERAVAVGRAVSR